MDRQELQDFRKGLIQRREDILARLLKGEEGVAPVAPDKAIGRLTRQEAILAQQMALELQRRLKLQLQQVNAALERLRNDSYGICLRCEEEIGRKRLEARPETPLCIQCAEDSSRSR